MEPGGAWRRYAWTRARAELLPKMPIEIVRRRVARARELGIDYKAYAGIRASTGRDIVALLFSDNALRLIRATARIEADRAARLGALTRTEILALVHPPHDPGRVTQANPFLLRADYAPDLAQTWGETRARVLDLTGRLPSDGVLVIGETHLERGWSEAARLAGFLPAKRYFAEP